MKRRYLSLAFMAVMAVMAVILYRDREHLYRFCQYPFPFIMCPQCEYPCFFQGHRLQEIIGLGVVTSGLMVGGVFCGAICPVGAVQDWLQSFKRRALSSFHYLIRLIFRSKGSAKSPAAKVREGKGILARRLRLLKYPLFLLVSLYALIHYAVEFNFMPDWGAVPAIRFTMQVREIAGDRFINFWLLFLVIVLGVGLVWHRPWCKYLCPYGLLFATINRISFLRIKRIKKLVRNGLFKKSRKENVSPTS